jgi:hypothetical protein
MILLLIFLTPAVGFWWLHEMAAEAVERNSLDHARDMLIRHVDRTRGTWPASWDDLAADFKPADAGYGTPSLDALKEVVAIDFTYDPKSAARKQMARAAPPRIIWLKSRPDTADVRQVNARLIDVLRDR